jgi:hypothetical protein
MVFLDSRLKVERANKHIKDIESSLRMLHDSQTSAVNVDPETGCETLIYEFPNVDAVFSDVALMLGDAVHNLNCALDYTWLETIKRLAPDAVNDRAKFPVRRTANELEGSLKKAEIDIASPALFNFMIRQIQPYDGGNAAIWPIHRLDIRDKHRLLIPVFTTAHVEQLEMEDETGEPITGVASTGDIFQKPPYRMPFRAGLHIKDYSKLTARILVHTSTGYIISVPETLRDYSHFIGSLVEAFERFLETQISE